MAGSVDSPRFSRDGGKGTLTDAPLKGVEGLISASTNRLLAGLSPSDFDILARHLKPVDLPLQKRLEVRRRAIEHVYFPESGFLSVVSDGENGDLVEIGMVGFEGMSGVPLLLGTDRSPNDTMVQNEGKGVRISATELSKAMRQSETLRNRLLLYAHA